MADYNKLNLSVYYLNYIFVLNIFIIIAIVIQKCIRIKSIMFWNRINHDKGKSWVIRMRKVKGSLLVRTRRYREILDNIPECVQGNYFTKDSLTAEGDFCVIVFSSKAFFILTTICIQNCKSIKPITLWYFEIALSTIKASPEWSGCAK